MLRDMPKYIQMIIIRAVGVEFMDKDHCFIRAEVSFLLPCRRNVVFLVQLFQFGSFEQIRARHLYKSIGLKSVL